MSGARQSEHDSFVLTRTAGRSGLIGEWKLTQSNLAVDQSTELTPSGQDGLTIRLLPVDFVCDAKFDGKDCPLTVPNTPPGEMTYALTQTGPRSVDVVQKRNGTTLATISYAVSDDGATMTTVSRPADGWPHHSIGLRSTVVPAGSASALLSGTYGDSLRRGELLGYIARCRRRDAAAVS
jgi:hypothetical protein